MGSSGETDTQSVLPCLQCWQDWRAAVISTWRQVGRQAGRELSMHTSCHCRQTPPFQNALSVVTRLSSPHPPLSDCSRLNSAWEQYVRSFPLEYRYRRISYRLGLHYSAVARFVWTDCSLAIRIPPSECNRMTAAHSEKEEEQDEEENLKGYKPAQEMT